MTDSNHEVGMRQMLGGQRFCYGAELVTTRGMPEEGEQHQLIKLGSALAEDPRIDWISITDNPGGNPMLPADWLGRILADRSVAIVIHLTCKDLNRNGLESAAWRYAAEGFDNILALTGDHPASGFSGQAKPVFDLDSVSLIALLSAMNEGIETPGRKGRTQTLPPTNFFIGAAVSPFKRHERELMPQYFKLARKLRCGAHWVIPQLGYDMRKFHEVRLFMDWASLTAPVIGNVYVLNKTVAQMFHDSKFPGCVVSDDLLATVKRYAGGGDKGRGYFQELAAKQLAVFKGLGFAGGYLVGTSKAETFGKIIDMAESFGENDWQTFAREIQFAQPDEFYLFDQDPQTHLGRPGSLNPEYLESLAEPSKTPQVTAGYRVARKVHDAVFTPGRGQFDHMTNLFKRLARRQDGLGMRALHAIERVSKHMSYGCKDCGDCSLPDCAYLCPQSSCSKGARNGPCGGSHDGRCELDDKQCLWARAYDRLKYYGESEHMLEGPAVFYDSALDGTSAWSNAFGGRDHHHYQVTVNGGKAKVGAEGAPAEAEKGVT